MSAGGPYLYSSRKKPSLPGDLPSTSRRTMASRVSKSTGLANKGAVPGGIFRSDFHTSNGTGHSASGGSST